MEFKGPPGELAMRMRGIVLCLLISLSLVGCQTWSPTAAIDPAAIPDQTYDVTFYKGTKPLSYAALFAIPDDGTPVVMSHTAFVKRIGLDSPGEYINLFETKVKGYKTLEIRDRQGNLRAYLLLYNFLYYEIDERPVGERIVVFIEPPHLFPVLKQSDP